MPNSCDAQAPGSKTEADKPKEKGKADHVSCWGVFLHSSLPTVQAVTFAFPPSIFSHTAEHHQKITNTTSLSTSLCVKNSVHYIAPWPGV